MFKGMNITVMGRSHEENGTVCQDSSGFNVSTEYSVSIVADGHGSKKHFRSDKGSKFAVESSIETIDEYLKDFDTFMNLFKKFPTRVLTMIQKRIISKWNDKIQAHYESNPITDKERSPFSESEFKEIKIESYYGTTLIIAVMCNEFAFGLQLGDGSLVVVNEVGEIEMPIIDDETHPANITASMCNSNAIELFNSFYTFTRPTAMLVSTDGLYTSFSSRSGFEEYNLIAISMLENFEEATKSLKSNLEKRTKYGSRDDISLAVILDERRRKSRQALVQASLEQMRKASEVKQVRQKAMRKKRIIRNDQDNND